MNQKVNDSSLLGDGSRDRLDADLGLVRRALDTLNQGAFECLALFKNPAELPALPLAAGIVALVKDEGRLSLEGHQLPKHRALFIG